jgi:GH18 family chitinase
MEVNITVAYIPEYRTVPSAAQLDKITYLVLFSITPGPYGTISVPSSGSGWAGNIDNIVNNAHSKGVKVIIAFGGWGRTGTFPEGVKPENRDKFVNNILAFVNKNNLDGVDINWEYPGSNIGRTPPLMQAKLYQEITDFQDFIILLKLRLGDKRLSFSIGMFVQPDFYTAKTLEALDALHIMTYDGNTGGGAHHADMDITKNVIDVWINSGKISREKIFFGIPFYGRGSGREESYSGIISSNPASLSQTDTQTNDQGAVVRYDGIPQVKEKTRFAQERNIGGVMIWELQHDVDAASEYSLLNAIWEQKQEYSEDVK